MWINFNEFFHYKNDDTAVCINQSSIEIILLILVFYFGQRAWRKEGSWNDRSWEKYPEKNFIYWIMAFYFHFYQLSIQCN